MYKSNYTLCQAQSWACWTGLGCLKVVDTLHQINHHLWTKWCSLLCQRLSTGWWFIWWITLSSLQKKLGPRVWQTYLVYCRVVTMLGLRFGYVATLLLKYGSWFCYVCEMNQMSSNESWQDSTAYCRVSVRSCSVCGGSGHQPSTIHLYIAVHFYKPLLANH